MVGADREEGADQHQGQGTPDIYWHCLLTAIAFPGGDRHQPQVLDQQGDRDIQTGDCQVVGELDAGYAQGAKDQQSRQLGGSDAKEWSTCYGK